MIIGYARVSTDGQRLDSQQASLKAAGAERIFAEKISGAVTDRKALAKALACAHCAKEYLAAVGRSPSRNESSIPRVARCRRSRSRKTWRKHMVGAITMPRSWTHKRRRYRRARHRSRWPRRFCKARSCGVSGCAQSTGAARPSVSA